MIVGHVTGQSLRLHHSAIADKTIDYLEAQFIFRTDDWKDMTTIKAVFELYGEEYAIPLPEDGRIRKEDHLNLSEGLWRVHLVGSRYDGEDVVERITTMQDVLRIMPTGGVDGDVLPEIPVTDVERLEARIAELEENAGGGDDKYVSWYHMITQVEENKHWLVLEFSDGTEMEIALPEMGIDIDRVVQFGTEDPTGETAGETKQLYINTSTGKMWVCKNGMMWPTQWISLSGGDDTGGGITNEELASAVDDALSEAKESGTFDGKDGKDGKDGANGKDGEDGVTPHIGANGNWFIGSTDTGVRAKGIDGKDGTSPVKGTDYFTAADKAELVAAVIAGLPVYDGEAVIL